MNKKSEISRKYCGDFARERGEEGSFKPSQWFLYEVLNFAIANRARSPLGTTPPRASRVVHVETVKRKICDTEGGTCTGGRALAVARSGCQPSDTIHRLAIRPLVIAALSRVQVVDKDVSTLANKRYYTLPHSFSRHAQYITTSRNGRISPR